MQPTDSKADIRSEQVNCNRTVVKADKCDLVEK